jgi:hypothetical protein
MKDCSRPRFVLYSATQGGGKSRALAVRSPVTLLGDDKPADGWRQSNGTQCTGRQAIAIENKDRAR